MNTIAITGRVGADAELAYTPQGSAVLKFSIAESRKNGEKWKTVWRTVKMFGKKAEDYHTRVKKGNSVIVFGSLEQDQYEKDGQAKTFDYIIGSGVSINYPNKITDQKTASGEEPEFSADDIPF